MSFNDNINGTTSRVRKLVLTRKVAPGTVSDQDTMTGSPILKSSESSIDIYLQSRQVRVLTVPLTPGPAGTYQQQQPSL